MPVGKMDILINIENATQVKNSTTGEMSMSWSTWLATWAEVIEKQSLEGEKAQQLTSTDEKIFRIRYEANITQKMRIYDPELARYYDILGIAMEGRKRYLLLTARSHNINAPA
jgi:SPP1 family predicted phage head-tail adaptor